MFRERVKVQSCSPTHGLPLLLVVLGLGLAVTTAAYKPQTGHTHTHIIIEVEKYSAPALYNFILENKTGR